MIIINYHQISPRGASSRYDMSLGLFQGQIDALIDHGFSFVTLAALLQTPSGEERPRQCAITFDDGRLGAYEHGARILRKRGIKATYFICPDWLEERPTAPAECYSDFMTWDHVAELLAEGNVIGSHGKSHLPFFEIDAGSAAREVSESKRLIEPRLGASCEHFAGPWGQIDSVVMSLVRDCGYKTLSSTVPGPNKVPYELYRLRRLDSSCYPSLASFTEAIRSHIEAHSRLDVVLLKLQGSRKKDTSRLEAIARFDLAICLDERSYELCTELGLPCLRYRPEPGWNSRLPRELLLKTHGEMARGREITFTPLTLRETHPAWTYLSSFLRGANRIR
jgi:peptidoglycan/xylan/chitin deacetylase (PgdA/CDA1 family)